MNAWHDPAIDEFLTSGGSHPRFGRDLVLMRGTGATSGEPRPHLARGIVFRDGWVVAGSFGGSPTDPAWVRNLRVHPDLELVVPLPGSGTRTHAVRAVELDGPAYAEARGLFLVVSPVFGRLEESAARRIPIFHLARR